MGNNQLFERVMQSLEGKQADRIPCINSVGTYTLDFMRMTKAYWPNSHKDPIKMARLASAAHKFCGLENVTVPFDTLVEAEALGAPINFHEGSVKWPSVRKFVAEDVSDISFPKEISEGGRLPVVLEAIRLLKKEFEGKVPVVASITPPFTCTSSYLVNNVKFLMSLILSPEISHGFFRNTFDVFVEIANLYVEAGADIITLHEMGATGDNISPKQFKEFVQPYLKKLIGEIRSPTILNICGSTSLIVDKMIECGANAIAIDERTQMAGARKIADKLRKNYPIIGNISSYDVIYKGPPEKIKNAVKEAINSGVSMVAPGCDFYLETPTKHIKSLVDATVEFGKHHC